MVRKSKAEQRDDRKIAVYARKSKITESGKSVENQITKCKSYANLKFDVGDEDILVYQDEGLSGYYSDRPQYMQMLQEIGDNKIRAVICYKFDRISRKTLDLLNLVEQLRVKKIAFISCTDDVDTSSKTGKIVMSLLASIAEFERDIIAERIADNMYELAKEGRWLGGTTPLGFYSAKEHMTVGGRKSTVNHLEPVENEQRIVKEMYEVFLEKCSLGKVVEWANQRKIITRQGKAHTRISVKNILQNPVYAIADADSYEYFKAFDVPIYAQLSDFDGARGLMIYNKTEQVKELREDSTAIHPEYVSRQSRRDVDKWIISVGKHKGIICGREWIRTQAILKDNRDKFNRPNEATCSLLSGIIACPVCGKNMYTCRESGRYTDGSPRFFYSCQTHRLNKSLCSYGNIKGNSIDQFILDAICEMCKPDDRYYHQLLINDSILQSKNNSKDIQIKQLSHRKAQLRRELEGQAKNLRIAGSGTKAVLLADMECLASVDKECTRQLEMLLLQKSENTQPFDLMNKTGEVILSFPCLLTRLSAAEKFELVHRTVKRVFVMRNAQGGDEVHIFMKGTADSFTYKK